ncbi:MAG: pitrilysin family protein [Bauldia sp.]
MRLRRHTAHAALAAALLVGAFAPAASLHGADAVPIFAPNVSSFTLANGMEVVVVPDHRGPVINHMVWYRVGSSDEVRGKSGIAHFLEHLMFKGTKAHPGGEFSTKVAAVGGVENASTSYDYTNYFQTVSKEYLPLMMELEADRMQNLVLTDAVVLPERDVVMEERRSRTDNSPGARLSEAVTAALYQNGPYGTPVIGWLHEMAQMTREDAVAWYNQYYTPNNAILVIAGDITPDEVRRLAEATYGKVPRRAEPPPRKHAREPEPQASRTLTLSDARVTQPSMQRSYLAPSYVTGPEKDALALDLLADILGSGSQSRFYKTLVLDKKIAASAGAFYSGNSLDEARFGISATPRGDTTLGDLTAALDEMIAAVIDKGVTEDELALAKRRVLAASIYQQDSQGGIARAFASSLAIGLTLKDVQEWPQRIQTVTAADIQAAAKKYLIVRRSVTGYLVGDPPPARI